VFRRNLQRVSGELAAIDDYRDALDKREYQLLKNRKGDMQSVDADFLHETAALREALETRAGALETNPETALASRMRELLAYKEGLTLHRFGETPSRKL